MPASKVNDVALTGSLESGASVELDKACAFFESNGRWPTEGPVKEVI